jgi:hypothetical protein
MAAYGGLVARNVSHVASPPSQPLSQRLCVGAWLNTEQAHRVFTSPVNMAMGVWFGWHGVGGV